MSHSWKSLFSLFRNVILWMPVCLSPGERWAAVTVWLLMDLPHGASGCRGARTFVFRSPSLGWVEHAHSPLNAPFTLWQSPTEACRSRCCTPCKWWQCVAVHLWCARFTKQFSAQVIQRCIFDPSHLKATTIIITTVSLNGAMHEPSWKMPNENSGYISRFNPTAALRRCFIYPGKSWC